MLSGARYFQQNASICSILTRAIKDFIKARKIIEGVPGGGTENNEDDGGDDNIETSLTRAEMETLALELNIKPEDIAKFNNAKLKKVLKKAGKLN